MRLGMSGCRMANTRGAKTKAKAKEEPSAGGRILEGRCDIGDTHLDGNEMQDLDGRLEYV